MTFASWETVPARKARIHLIGVATMAIRRAATPLVALRSAWSRRRTLRILESLPMDIRKDIGYPTTTQSPREPNL